jgi:hypothetical protein
MTRTFFLQNAPLGDAFATVDEFPRPGARVISQPYNGGPAQQWIPAQYPGTDLNDTGGVVCALHTVGAKGLVLTAGPCDAYASLQPFEAFNLYQLWSYQGTHGSPGVWVNLATGCVMDSEGAKTVLTWANEANDNQLWTVIAIDDDGAVATRSAPELAAASA